VLATIAGCGKKGPQRAPVIGTIRYEGRPVAGATVTFVPVDRLMRPASAMTDNEGRYRLQTIGMGPGAIVGQHQVGVVLREPSPAVTSSGGSNPILEMQNRPLGRPLLPIQYFTPEDSGLTADVADVPENQFDFDLLR
jgi:hypothetical protein